MENYKIVCIDDESFILEFYEDILSELEYDTVLFEKPYEALDYIKENHKNIALIISDFKMPDATGFEVREKMLEYGIQTPFVVVTGFFDKKMAVRAMALKIPKVFDKPSNPDEVYSFVKEEAGKWRTVLEEDREMIVGFLEETRPMLEEIEELILTLEDEPENQKAINTYFRLLHTIKGTSSCLGLKHISEFAHNYEDLINKVKSGKQAVTTLVIDVFLKGLDQLEKMYTTAEQSKIWSTPISEITSIFEIKEDVDVERSDDTTLDTGSGKADLIEDIKTAAKEDKISIAISHLGEFMESSGELTVLRNTIFKTLHKLSSNLYGNKDFDILMDAMEEMQKVSGNLQTQVADMMKVSMDTVYRPMKRVVRDSSKVCNKKIDFSSIGGDLMIDTTVGKLLNSVLVHLLRNSVDHGIEPLEARKAAGKNEEGKVTINSYESGEDIYIEITDDGGGLNPDVLKNKVIEKGMYTLEEVEKMSENRLFQVIFESGFSTAKEVTSISGRGVGMDMVKSSIDEFGGRVFVESVLGKGCKFVLIVPIPRSIQIIKSLMVDCKGSKFSIPLDNVAEVVLWEEGKKDFTIEHIYESKILRHHEELVPLGDLGTLFNLSHEEEIKDSMSIVVIRSGKIKFGLIVDSIEDIEEIVVKKMQAPLNSLSEYLGATFIGEGELSMILDPIGIGRLMNLTDGDEEDNYGNTSNDGDVSEVCEYMRFHLEEHQNYALPLQKVFRLEEIEKNRIEFSGDLPLVSYRDGSMPLILVQRSLNLSHKSLNDFLNNHELLNVIVVRDGGKYVGLVVEEMIDIGVSFSSLDTNVSDREGVLGTVFIDDKIVNVVDDKFILNSSPLKNKKMIKALDNTAMAVDSSDKLELTG